MKKLSTLKKLQKNAISLDKIRGGDIKESSSSYTSGGNTYYTIDRWEDKNCDGIFGCDESGCYKTTVNVQPKMSQICEL